MFTVNSVPIPDTAFATSWGRWRRRRGRSAAIDQTSLCLHPMLVKKVSSSIVNKTKMQIFGNPNRTNFFLYICIGIPCLKLLFGITCVDDNNAFPSLFFIQLKRKPLPPKKYLKEFYCQERACHLQSDITWCTSHIIYYDIHDNGKWYLLVYFAFKNQALKKKNKVSHSVTIIRRNKGSNSSPKNAVDSYITR